jgi:glycosyltransferase involved in cell wall biosynthesis
MRIGFDGSCLGNRRGFGRFAREILRALSALDSSHDFTVFIDSPSAGDVAVPDGMNVVTVPLREAPTQAASAAGRRRIGDMLAMGKAVARSGVDLMYFPATYSFFPVWNVPRVVVTLHDTLALAHPEWVFPTRAGRWAWAIKEHWAVRSADTIATVSETSRRDLIGWFKLPEARVTVVTEGPDSIFVPRPGGAESDRVLRKHGLKPGGRFLLYVGGLSPHKNLPRLIEAFAKHAAPDVNLALVGDFGDVFHTHVPELRAVVQRFQVADRVHLTGFVPDLELSYLYSRCHAFVQPSLMEGFGLPPVEAMACGAPVLHSIAGSLPEIMGGAGAAFDPYQVDEIGLAIRSIDDPEARETFTKRSQLRAGTFRWSTGARSLMDAFEALNPLRNEPTPGRTARRVGRSRSRLRTTSQTTPGFFVPDRKKYDRTDRSIRS